MFECKLDWNNTAVCDLMILIINSTISMRTFKIAHLLVLLSLTYILLGCSKIEMPKPTIVTLDIMGITVSSAESGGVFSSDNGSKVTDRGICWSLKPNPTLKDSVIKDEGDGTGTFNIDLTNLNSSTTYYVCAFATNAGGTAYGNELSFTTQNGLIGISTDAASSITRTSATIAGTISGDGGSNITERGIYWSTSANSTISGQKIAIGNGTGNFSKEMNNLTPNTTYYFCSFATNSFGTVFGNEVSITTLAGVPKACFTYSNYNGYTVNFTNCSDFPTTCLWDFGDGTTSTVNEPTHIFSNLGTYNVKLTVTNDGLSDFVTKMITLNDEVSLNNIKPTLYPSTYAFVDVDFDNVNDFAFSINYQSHPISLFTYEASSISAFNGYEIFSDTVIVNQYYTPNLGNSINVTMVIPRVYSQGSTILNSTKTKTGNLSLCTYSYNGYGLSYRLDDWISNVDRYVGFRKVVGDKTKIGWIKLQIADYASVTLRSFKIPTDGESLVIDK